MRNLHGRAVAFIVLALGVTAYVRASTARPSPAVASTETPGMASADFESTERETIPTSCQELLADPPPSPPDHKPIVFTNATVLTMDPEGNRATSVSIEGGRIVGTSEEAGSGIDLEGATVLPGFIDSHSHWIGDRDFVGQTAKQSIRRALSRGWTSISELFVSFERLGELCDLEMEGKLRIKVGAFLPLNYQFQRFGNWYDDYEPGEEFGPHVWVQGLKFFADGAPDGLGYQTDPPSPSVQGKRFWKPRRLKAAFRHANDAGWQIAIHATGDGGLDLALDAYSTLGRKDIVAARDRVEHLSTVRTRSNQAIAQTRPHRVHPIVLVPRRCGRDSDPLDRSRSHPSCRALARPDRRRPSYHRQHGSTVGDRGKTRAIDCGLS